MGGKGQPADGGDTRLPPPPNLKELAAIPSKLRKIMELRNSNKSCSAKPVKGWGFKMVHLDVLVVWKPKTDAVPDFPGCEEIKFDEIVEDLPKLLVYKESLDAFHERIRLEAIEAYKNQKGWTSRRGVQIPIAGKSFLMT